MKRASDIYEAVKTELRTITDFYKLKKQILQSFIVPCDMCKKHSAGESLSVTAETTAGAESRTRTLRGAILLDVL